VEEQLSASQQLFLPPDLVSPRPSTPSLAPDYRHTAEILLPWMLVEGMTRDASGTSAVVIGLVQQNIETVI
jgi:hypothetical protein